MLFIRKVACPQANVELVVWTTPHDLRVHETVGVLLFAIVYREVEPAIVRKIVQSLSFNISL